MQADRTDRHQEQDRHAGCRYADRWGFCLCEGERQAVELRGIAATADADKLIPGEQRDIGQFLGDAFYTGIDARKEPAARVEEFQRQIVECRVVIQG